MATKTVMVISDLHCGHIVGLTPKKYRSRPTLGRQERNDKLLKKQTDLWDWWAAASKPLRGMDLLVVNGDAVDGVGKKSGGTEQISTDMNYQVQMAIDCIEELRPKRVMMTYGTGYHTGNDCDWEDPIAKHLGADIGGHKWATVNGVTLDFKHKVGSSGIPHGRHGGVAKERLWNLIWAMRKEAPQADVLIRSHVHYFDYCGGREWLAMTTPALQGMGSKFGGRQCSGTVDFGFVTFEITHEGELSWAYHVAPFSIQQSTGIKI